MNYSLKPKLNLDPKSSLNQCSDYVGF